MAKVDTNIKKHQKGASYMPLNASSAKVLADALNITNVRDVKRTGKKKSTKKNSKPKATANVTTDAS